MTGEFNFFNHPAFQAEDDSKPEQDIIRVIVFGSREGV